MKKVFLATVLSIGFSAAWAVDWDANDDFILLSDDGTVVGQGELEDDGLELKLLSGYTGFIRFDAGDERVEGIVNADGTITLYNTSGFVELDDDLSSQGYNLVVTPVDSIAAPASVVVTPTNPSRDDDNDDTDGDSTPDVPGSGNDDDGNRDNDNDDDSSGTSGSGDDNSSPSGNTDDNNDDNNDDRDDSSGSTDDNSGDDGD
jgi:hypothetical protein